MASISAVVVGFKPDFEVLNKLIADLIHQVDFLILVDNGGSIDFLKNHPELRNKVIYYDMHGNKGLGAALNIGFKISVENNVDYVVTFDQDSHVSLSLIKQLYESMQKSCLVYDNCAAVSPVFFDYRDKEKIYFPFYESRNGQIKAINPLSTDSDYVEASTLITSGMMVKSAVWKSGIQYSESLFVDYTDPEWCFRVRSQGYVLLGCLRVEMGHAPSDAPPARIFGFSFFRYSPLRRYYFFRNTIAVTRLSYVETHWKKRLLLGLFLRFFVNLCIDKRKIKSFLMMCKGTYHGLIGRSGPYK